MMVKKWSQMCRQEIRRCFAGWSRPAMLIGAFAMMVAGWLTRSVCGSPNQQGIMLQFGDQIPPVWVMTVLWTLWYLILGGMVGGIMSDRRENGWEAVCRYRGALLFLCMAFLGFLWYPVFFVCARFFVAAIMLLLVLACCGGCAWFYAKASRLVGGVLLVHAVFLLWLLVINVKIAFLN